ncbi:MAG TPA: hypothetical protein VKD22_04885, partial [Ramlibacter sp.]|nr:hypothetical protein [Ramlibacter sp.]
PGREPDAALALVRTGFGPTGSLEHDGQHELVLLPAFKVDVVGIDQRSIAAVHDELCRAVSAMVQPIAPALWPGPEPAQRAGPYVPTIPLPLQLQ